MLWACGMSSATVSLPVLPTSRPHRLTPTDVSQFAAMVDRFNRIFLRTLRALRDLRRYAPATVVVQNAGQVNVGGQQVNMAAAKQGA
jgi:hypothetical protein